MKQYPLLYQKMIWPSPKWSVIVRKSAYLVIRKFWKMEVWNGIRLSMEWFMPLILITHRLKMIRITAVPIWNGVTCTEAAVLLIWIIPHILPGCPYGKNRLKPSMPSISTALPSQQLIPILKPHATAVSIHLLSISRMLMSSL